MSDPRTRDLDLVSGRALRSGFLLQATPGNVRLLGVFGRELGPGRERLPGKEPGKLSNSDMSFASIALFCFIFKALFSKKFMPLSSSESELESVTEFSGGSEGTVLLLAAPLVLRVGNFMATRRGPDRVH